MSLVKSRLHKCDKCHTEVRPNTMVTQSEVKSRLCLVTNVIVRLSVTNVTCQGFVTSVTRDKCHMTPPTLKYGCDNRCAVDHMGGGQRKAVL